MFPGSQFASLFDAVWHADSVAFVSEHAMPTDTKCKVARSCY